MKERMLTVLVPIKDSDATLVESLPPVNPDNINVIFKYNGAYYRVYYDIHNNTYEYRIVVDREFPEIGKPLEIFDFVYDASRMGTTPTISASNVMWFADKVNGQDVTLEDRWIQYGQQCHVSFNGENFYLKQIPTSGKSNEDARYRYDIDFVSERAVLETVYLYDVVQPFVTEKPISESSTFSFYGDISELAKRINASLIRSGLASLVRKTTYYDTSHYSHSGQPVPVRYLTYSQWNLMGVDQTQLAGVFENSYELETFQADIYEGTNYNYNQYLMQYIYENVNGEYTVIGYQCVIGKDKKGELTTSEEKLITFENNKIHEALQQFHDTFGVQYYVTKEKNSSGVFTGNTLIVVADCEHDFADMNQSGTDYVRDDDGIPTTTHPFDYGVEDALLSKEKTNTTDKIITRITGIGSEENIPWYYPNPTADGWIKPLYKRNGVEQSVTISYPTSESNTNYEKYLKNRLGHIFNFGTVRVMKSETQFFGAPSGWGTENGQQFLRALYYISTTGVDNPKLTIDLSLLQGSMATSCKIYIKDVTATPSISILTNHVWDMSDDNFFYDVYVEKDKKYSVDLYFYVTGKPTTRGYDYIGYYYQYHSWQPTHVGDAIKENFYDEGGLIACHNSNYSKVGYAPDGNPDNIATPMSRVESKRYKDLGTGSIYRCSTSNSKTNEPYQINPEMPFDEWISTFMRLSIKIYKAEGWYKDGKQCDLSDYGLTIQQESQYVMAPVTETIFNANKPAYYIYDDRGLIATYTRCTWSTIYSNIQYYTLRQDIFDSIEFQRLKYLTPQPNLMPEVYVKTDGERRFYNATNYPLTSGTADTAIGEETGSGGQIINPIYYKEGTSSHYDFESEYEGNAPKEHIETIDDVKPTIKGQRNNYIPVSVTQQQFEADKTFFYTYNSSTGNYTQCESGDSYDGSTQYYANLRIDVVEEFAYDELDDDDVWESNDDGNISGEYKHPYFFAKLRPMGFNLFDLALQDDMVISMTTGNCGACNFKIGVDENTKKNPVQIWEYNVYKGSDWDTKVLVYNAGELRRYIDTSDLYYDKDGTPEHYVQVDSTESMARSASLIVLSGETDIKKRKFERLVYSSELVKSGSVGSLKQDNKSHTEGDVKTSGPFIASQQDTTNNYVWVALMKDTDTYGVLMPSARPDYADENYSFYIRPQSVADVLTSQSIMSEDEENANKFVIINIRLPQAYLRNAERELSKRLVAYMYDNNYQKFNFSIKFSRIFLAQNSDVDNELNENSVLYVSFNNRIYRQYVKHYTYRMERDQPLPEISVDMNEELSVSRTLVEREAVAQANTANAIARQMRRSILSTENRIGRRTIGRNEDVLISGNIVSRDAVASLSDLQVARRLTETNLSDTQLDLDANHFRKTDFTVFDGTDLKIGYDIHLPTSFKDGNRIIRRTWNETTGKFERDSDNDFAPIFNDTQ